MLSHLFTPLFMFVHDLPIFASYYAFVIVSRLIGFLSVTRLSLLYKFTRFFNYFLFLSDEGPMRETLDYTIRIGSAPTFLYFDLYLYSAYAARYVYFTDRLSLFFNRNRNRYSLSTCFFCGIEEW